MNPEVLLGPARLIARPIRFILAWSPVWIPAILIWQFSTLGLKPTQAEQARLKDVTPEVLQRYEEQRANFEVMAAEVEAWTDPVFQERQRRRRLRAAAREASATLPTQADAGPAQADASKQGR